MSAVVSDWRYILKDFFQTLLKEPIIRIFLYLDKIGHLKDFFSMGIAHADAFSGFDWFNSIAIHLTFFTP